MEEGCWLDGYGIGIRFAQSELGITEPRQESPVGYERLVQWEYLE